MIILTKEMVLEVELKDFELTHHVDIQHVQVARAIVDANSKVIDNCIKKGLAADSRLGEIFADEMLQDTYTQMAEALDNGNVNAFEPLYNHIKDETDIFCGWLAYYNRHLEITLHLDLEKRSRLDYYCEDYIEDN